jgi:hypothetical protein
MILLAGIVALPVISATWEAEAKASDQELKTKCSSLRSSPACPCALSVKYFLPP